VRQAGGLMLVQVDKKFYLGQYSPIMLVMGFFKEWGYKINRLDVVGRLKSQVVIQTDKLDTFYPRKNCKTCVLT